MKNQNFYSIKSTITFSFNNPSIRDISFDSFQPELNKSNSHRSKVTMEKQNIANLFFNIQSKDITAFRASINEIISFGKIIQSILEIL